MNNAELETKIKEFEKKTQLQEKIKGGWAKHAEFLKLFPFREHPELIDNLTPEQAYNPEGKGEKNYFFNWIEHKLKAIGHLTIGGARVWVNARDNIGIFKELLKTAMDDSLSISEKVDSHWEDIKGFGGDRHIAKKIIACYYPEKVLSVYKTEDLEELAEALGLEYRDESYKKYKEDYELLSVGKKFELLNVLFLDFKNRHPKLKNWDNGLFGGFLYESFPVSRVTNHQADNKISGGRKLKAFSSYGLVYEPRYEQEVVFLFSKYHIKLGFPVLTRIAPAFPDAEALDESGKYKKIEFEVMSSDFISHGHDPKGCDYIICWEDNLTEEQKMRKGLPRIISLKEELGK